MDINAIKRTYSNKIHDLNTHLINHKIITLAS